MLDFCLKMHLREPVLRDLLPPHPSKIINNKTQYKHIHPSSLLHRHLLGRKRHLTTTARLRIRILLHKEPLPHQLILIINNTPLHQVQALLLNRELHPCICLIYKVVVVEGGVEEEFVFEALAAFAGLDREAEELGEVGELLGGEDVLAGLGEGDLGGDAGVAGDEAREGEH